jgi:hypothetical protein
LQKKELLRALTELPFVAETSDLKPTSGSAPPVYNRIGNDIEQIAFFGRRGSAVKALLPLQNQRPR